MLPSAHIGYTDKVLWFTVMDCGEHYLDVNQNIGFQITKMLKFVGNADGQSIQ